MLEQADVRAVGRLHRAGADEQIDLDAAEDVMDVETVDARAQQRAHERQRPPHQRAAAAKRDVVTGVDSRSRALERDDLRQSGINLSIVW